MSRYKGILTQWIGPPPWEARLLAASEAARLTPTAESCAPSGAPMSGGAEPAGAAKPSPEQT